jgi:hypothetical protein
MAQEFVITCPTDLSNFFSRSQNYLDKEFGKIETVHGVWEGKVKSGGQFPQSTGWAARHTVLGDQRINQTQIQFFPMVGHQDNCAASCDANPVVTQFQAVDHRWYRVMQHSRVSPVYCLKTMWQESFELEQQVAQQFRMLKEVTLDVDDEFYRTGVVFNSDNHWVAINNTTSNPQIVNNISGVQAWSFPTDANGYPIIDKIVLNPAYTPQQIGYLTVETLNRVRRKGIYNGAFSKGENMEVMSDWETFDYMVKLDSNQRQDNRWRDPEVLNPRLGNVYSYAMYDCTEDPFQLRYFWDLNDPNYPNGVLTRINPWHNAPVTEGCFSEGSDDFINADFALHIPWNGKQCMWQHTNYPTSLPGQNFQQPFSPYNGMWRWENNKYDNIVGQNIELNKGYWFMVWEKAMKPYLPQLGHVILTRRPYTSGVIASCRPLQVPGFGSGSGSCFNPCPPYDFWPPALVAYQTCGSWNSCNFCQ